MLNATQENQTVCIDPESTTGSCISYHIVSQNPAPAHHATARCPTSGDGATGTLNELGREGRRGRGGREGLRWVWGCGCREWPRRFVKVDKSELSIVEGCQMSKEGDAMSEEEADAASGERWTGGWQKEKVDRSNRGPDRSRVVGDKSESTWAVRR
jgi:hypothetical protein